MASEGYKQVIKDIAKYVAENAPEWHLIMTRDQYQQGVSSLGGQWADLRDEAIKYAIKNHYKPIEEFDITYNQKCLGFFEGIRDPSCKTVFAIKG